MSTPLFRIELEQLLNSRSMENGSNTPDYILADYLLCALQSFDRAVSAREQWYGRVDAPTIPGDEMGKGETK